MTSSPFVRRHRTESFHFFVEINRNVHRRIVVEELIGKHFPPMLITILREETVEIVVFSLTDRLTSLRVNRRLFRS